MYSREIDRQVLTLAPSGWTYDNTFVLYDKETESLWYHLSGEDGLTCIGGRYKDGKLKELSSVTTRWSTWQAQKPHTKFLKF